VSSSTNVPIANGCEQIALAAAEAKSGKIGDIRRNLANRIRSPRDNKRPFAIEWLYPILHKQKKDDTMTTTKTAPRSDRVNPALAVPTDLAAEGVSAIAAELRGLLADVFALYVKTKNFHWHMSGTHFRDYHLLLDEQADQVFAMTDDIAERARKIGATSLRSIGDIAGHQRLPDNDEPFVTPHEMLTELANDNRQLTQFLRAAHEVCDEHHDVATASLIENWIDETERRTWFLTESAGRE
jgi:starvation-inducible DNA-binding protein